MDAESSDREELADASVTVVVPALNAAGTLRRQLDALDRQTFERPFCVVVVDNASEDNTAEVALGRQPERYQIRVVHEPRRGINFARNAGIATAPEGMILLCDADDEVDEPWLAAMVEALTPGYWVGGVLGYEKLNSPRTRRFWDVSSYSVFRPTDPYIDDTKGSNCGFYQSMWTALDGFDERLSGTGDENEFFMRAHHAGYRPIHVVDAVVNYRLRPGLRSMVRQRYRQGKNQISMSRLPGGRLLPYSFTARSCLRATAKAVAVGPRDLISSQRRYLWIASVSRHAGRLVGLSRTMDNTRAHS